MKNPLVPLRSYVSDLREFRILIFTKKYDFRILISIYLVETYVFLIKFRIILSGFRILLLRIGNIFPVS